MECLSYQAAFDFIIAWKEHDRAALRLSTAVDTALKNGKPYYMPTLALKKETDRYVHTEEIFAKELGINPVHLSRSLSELRREGVDHEKAVELIISYLNRSE